MMEEIKTEQILTMITRISTADFSWMCDSYMHLPRRFILLIAKEFLTFPPQE